MIKLHRTWRGKCIGVWWKSGWLVWKDLHGIHWQMGFTIMTKGNILCFHIIMYIIKVYIYVYIEPKGTLEYMYSSLGKGHMTLDEWRNIFLKQPILEYGYDVSIWGYLFIFYNCTVLGQWLKGEIEIYEK